MFCQINVTTIVSVQMSFHTCCRFSFSYCLSFSLCVFFFCLFLNTVQISPHYEMISNVELCYVVSVQNQLTLRIATVIVRQIPVARKLKLLFGDCADARNKIAESL